jgi:hypothetical protein
MATRLHMNLYYKCHQKNWILVHLILRSGFRALKRMVTQPDELHVYDEISLY